MKPRLSHTGKSLEPGERGMRIQGSSRFSGKKALGMRAMGRNTSDANRHVITQPTLVLSSRTRPVVWDGGEGSAVRFWLLAE
jgi:hypothetical protein